MTVSSTSSKVKFVGNNSTTVFNFSYTVYAASDLVVTLTNSDGVDTTLTEGTGAGNYSVTVASFPGAGSITYPATGSTRLQADESLTISRVIPLTQTIDLQNQGGYFPDVQEEGFDRGIYISQQLKEESDRSIKASVSDSSPGVALPAAAARANRIMAFDGSGDVTTVATDSLSLATLQAFTNWKVDVFTAGSNQTVYALSADPGQKTNTTITIDGVTQEQANYSWAGQTITLSTAPATGSKVEIRYGQAAGTYVPVNNSIPMEAILTSDLDTDLSSVSGADDTLASAKAIKTYVDAQVDTVDTLAEVLANGNGTGGTDIAVGANDDITLVDGANIKWGTGGDGLGIYHNGLNSYITEIGSGTGNLFVLASDLTLGNKGNSQHYAHFVEGGEAKLFYDNDLKYETTNGGGKVTGDLQITGGDIELGSGNDTTISRASAGVVTIEGQTVRTGTVAVANGGTGATSLTDGGVLLGSGSGAITAMGVLGDGEVIVGDGSGDPVAESGATLRTSIGVGTGDSPQFTGLTLTGNADIDGTTNLDAVDIDGAVQIDSTVTVGVDDTGYDVKFFGDTASAYMLWDASQDDLILGGAAKLAIGLTNPLYPVTVAGSDGATNMMLQSTSGLHRLAIYNDSSQQRISTYNNTALTFAINESEHIRLDNAGRLGVGDSSPNTTAKMTVTGADGAAGSLNYVMAVRNSDAFSTTPAAGILFQNKYNSGGSYADAGGIEVVKENATDGEYGFGLGLHTRANGAAVSEKLHITGAGNTSLTGNLHILDNKYLNIGTSNDLSLFHDGNDSHIVDQGTGNFFIKTNGTAIKMQTYGGEDLATFTKDGSVDLFYDNEKKIATTTSGVHLTSTAPTIRLEDTQNNYSGYINGDNGNVLIQSYNANRDIIFGENAASGEIARITGLGKFGIGTSSPSNILDLESTSPELHINDSNATIGGSINSRVIFQAAGSEHGWVGLSSSAGTMGLINNQGDLWISADPNNAHSNSAIKFVVDAGEKAYITATGLGVGATPTAPLDVRGYTSNVGVIYGNAGAASQHLMTLTDGVATNFSVVTSGSVLTLGSDAGSTQTAIKSTGQERIRIDASGRVGIGSSSPAARTHLDGDANTILRIDSQNTASTAGTAMGEIQLHGKYHTGSALHTSYAASVIKNVKDSADGTGGSAMTFSTSGDGSAGLAERLRVTKAGHFGIGSSSPDTALTISKTSTKPTGDANAYGVRLYPTSSGACYLDAITASTSTANMRIRTYNGSGGSAYYHEWTFNEAGVLNTAGGVTVNGALSKSSGSFKIDHPLPAKRDTHHLVHSFTESPQADLIYRGRATLVDGEVSVDIDDAAGMTSGTFEVLCRDVQCFTSNETGWTAVRGSVTGATLTIEAQDNSCTDTISWMVVGERKDPHMFDTDWTDDDGKVIVEPLKPTEEE
jgi:hypothetical protein